MKEIVQHGDRMATCAFRMCLLGKRQLEDLASRLKGSAYHMANVWSKVEGAQRPIVVRVLERQ